MRVFAAVARGGSLSAASRTLGIPLPTVSRKIAELEAHLKTGLLIRSTRTLGLTEAGALYLVACNRILEEVGEAERAASGEYTMPRGELTVGAPIVFGRLHVLPVIADFLAAYPEITARLVLSDRFAQLIDDQIDVALRIGPLADSQLIASKLGSVAWVVCGSPAYFGASGTPTTPADLADHACIAFDRLGGDTSWNFAAPGSVLEQPVTIHPRLTVNTAEAAIDAACADVGIARVLSYQAASRVAAGELRIILAQHQPRPLPVNFLHTPRPALPLKIRSFLDLAVPPLRKALAAVSV